ncbi:MAG: hypothetical protein KJ698_11065 [Actinobacteria bacterium]|nr:hypothetical protein [Actinomycetota bacterium]MBU1494329.1 hypothetical protein [Actinomycetota bacterium]
MQCERCGENAATRRGDQYLCGRCALRLDWEGVALAVQGSVVLEAAITATRAAAAPQAAAAAPDAPAAPSLPPADPFAG